MLNTILNPENRVMSKRDRVPTAMWNGVHWETDTKGSVYKDISGRRIIQTKEQRPHRELYPPCMLSKAHMSWSSECG